MHVQYDRTCNIAVETRAYMTWSVMTWWEHVGRQAGNEWCKTSAAGDGLCRIAAMLLVHSMSTLTAKKTPQSPWRWSQRCSYITMTQQLRRKRTPERCRWASVAYWDSQPSQYCTVYYDRKRLRPSVLCYIYCSPTLTVINSHECANGLILCALQWSSVFRCKNRNFEQQQYTRLHAIRRTNYVVRRRLSAVA